MKTAVLSTFLISISSIFCFSQSEDTPFSREINFGFGNLGASILHGLQGNNPFPDYMQYEISGIEQIDSNLFVRIGISSVVSSQKLGNIRQYNFVPFNGNIGIEKRKVVNDGWKLGYGIDLFYSMSFRGAIVAVGQWVGDDIGIGTNLVLSSIFPINNKLSIATELKPRNRFIQRISKHRVSNKTCLSSQISPHERRVFHIKI